MGVVRKENGQFLGFPPKGTGEILECDLQVTCSTHPSWGECGKGGALTATSKALNVLAPRIAPEALVPQRSCHWRHRGFKNVLLVSTPYALRSEIPV